MFPLTVTSTSVLQPRNLTVVRGRKRGGHGDRLLERTLSPSSDIVYQRRCKIADHQSPRIEILAATNLELLPVRYRKLLLAYLLYFDSFFVSELISLRMSMFASITGIAATLNRFRAVEFFVEGGRNPWKILFRLSVDENIFSLVW